ncbi:MAG: flagellar basal body P-ring formation protein FlgA [Proteobacteria bacterium]|nr:flagellar basal body P-ring formation protein FlgA [Pseudomonadota bacterium]
MHQDTLRTPIRRLALAMAAASALAGIGTALAAPPGEPLPEASRLAVERLVQTQSKGLPGEISLQLQGSHNLPPCDAPEAFLAPGTELRGRISIGLRCVSPAPWKRFVQAYIGVRGRYYVAAQPIEAGQPLGVADIGERSGDLAALPRSVVTDPSALHGVVAANRIAAGAPLRKELLRGTVVIQQGQTVKVVAQGAGYSVSTEGRAMTRAAVGATVQAKTRDGRLVSGVADEEGQIRLAQ